MKKFLGNREIKHEILNFDISKSNVSVIKSVEKLLDIKEESFREEKIYRVSVAAAPLAAWVKANLKYAIVSKNINPLREELRVANTSIQMGEKRLKESENELDVINNLLCKLKADFSKRTRDAESCRIDYDKTESKLSRAKILLENLGSKFHILLL